MITKQEIAQQLLQYLNHRITLAALVNWAEDTIMNGGLDPSNAPMLMQVLGRIAAADVKEFGLFWEDCESIMRALGYTLKVDASLAA
ncbi:MAG: hypothetical protein SFW35_11610 [Chitinophagales bacterium]|nr:hypothetical protein [Chitinophagales bacterium]